LELLFVGCKPTSNRRNGLLKPGLLRDAFIIGLDVYMRLFWATFYEGFFADSGVSTMNYSSSCIHQLATVGDDYLYFGGTNPNQWSPLACPSTDNPYCQPGNFEVETEPVIGRFDISIYPELSVLGTGSPKQSIELYPVPSADVITMSPVLLQNAQVQIYDAMGQLVRNLQNQNLMGGLQMDIKYLAEGMYIVEVLDQQNISFGKAQFIKIK